MAADIDVINLDDCGVRLSVYQKTRIDLIKESVPKPDGYLPPRSLPTWEYMPLEQKLPMLPAPPGAIYFSRGTIGKTLLHKNVIYSMADPMNRERVPTNNYEILHDPAAKVDANPHAREFLTQHGAVNENGEVICTLQEFNRYRKYLATLYSDKVREKLVEIDQLKEFERETTKALIEQEIAKKAVGRQAIRNMRVEKAKKFLIEKEEAKRQRLAKAFLLKQHMAEKQKLAVEQERVILQAEKVKRGEEKRVLQMRRLEEKKAKENEQRRHYLYTSTLHDMTSMANREHHQNQRQIERENKLAEWFDSKLVSAAERLHREKEIQAEYTLDIKRRAKKRQKNVERFRAELSTRIAKRLAEKERLDNVVRKYAMRWLNKVRDRLRKPVDEMHESLWYSSHYDCLQEGVKYLYEQSGYEKLDDVVMNILKFKEALKRQMLMEDEEEDEDEDDEDDDEY